MVEELYASLSDVMKQGVQFNSNDVCKIAVAILKAFRELHNQQRQVIRDVKPSNIMLRKTEHNHYEVVLIDLGTTFFNGHLDTYKKAVGNGFVGNYKYCSLAMHDRPCSYADDFISLGYLLYELLTNQPLPWATATKESDIKNLKLQTQNEIINGDTILAEYMKEHVELPPKKFPHYKQWIDFFNGHITELPKTHSLFSDNAAALEVLAKLPSLPPKTVQSTPMKKMPKNEKLPHPVESKKMTVFIVCCLFFIL